MRDQIIICRRIIKKHDAGTPGNERRGREFHIPGDCNKKRCIGSFILGKTEPLHDCFEKTALRSIEEAKKVAKEWLV